MIASKGDSDDFEVNDVGHGLGNESKKVVQNATGKAATKRLFSSPQNRRATLTKMSQESENSSNSGKSRSSSIHGSQGGEGRSGARSLRGSLGGDGKVVGIDSSLRGGVSDRTTWLVSTATSAPDATAHAMADSTGHRSRGIAVEEHLSDARTGVNRVQDILGTLPILLVDDSVSILKMTKRAIQNECANISFIEAKNGEEALARVVEAYASFELIITDIQMPICNGFEFTRRVRQLERDKGLNPKLIIGISANDQQKIAIEAKESGMVLS